MDGREERRRREDLIREGAKRSWKGGGEQGGAPTSENFVGASKSRLLAAERLGSSLRFHRDSQQPWLGTLAAKGAAARISQTVVGA
ncbi:hypothetical protein KM043_018128 [Ampulex compressa]|nr:hypothetical protein KM043_018128 [Ampulex compressa]